jgi:hypothetical protein
VKLTADLPDNSQPFSSVLTLQLGIGTLWERNGLLEADGCTYKADTAASKEYQTLSDCTTAIPLEREGGAGTACGHWDEDCLMGELMTGFATDGLEISRMTVGGLKDLGYEVDYSKADAFPQSKLDPTCVCTNVQGATTEKNAGFKLDLGNTITRPAPTNGKGEKKVAGGFKLGPPLKIPVPVQVPEPTNDEDPKRGGFKLGGSATITRTRSHPHDRSGNRKLSDDGFLSAKSYAIELLKEMRRLSEGIQVDEESVYLGDKFLTVFFMEQGHVYALDVWGGEDLEDL